MTLLASEKSHLLLIDFQQRLMPAMAGADAVLANAVRLGESARLLAVPILRTEQYPKGLGSTVPELAGFGAMIEKMHFSACREPAFAALDLRQQVIVAGVETHVCVLQTVLELCRAGRQVFVVGDAVASRTAANRQAGLERMARAGATIVTTEMVVFEWLGSAENPHFRALSRLIR